MPKEVLKTKKAMRKYFMEKVKKEFKGYKKITLKEWQSSARHKREDEEWRKELAKKKEVMV